MISLNRKRRFDPIRLDIVFSLLFLINALSLAFAFTMPVTSSAAHAAATTRTTTESSNGMRVAGLARPPSPLPVTNNQVNNQSYRGSSNSGNISTYTGKNQGNSGNQGINRGLNQDNGSNSGNQISGQRKVINTQVNNQYLQQSSSGKGNTTNLAGTDQGNSGNQGINRGLNQDNASNSGNQVNNQGNTIGTQINNQGSTVNNQGNVIHKQINYINLLPMVHIYFSLNPTIQLGLSLGN